MNIKKLLLILAGISLSQHNFVRAEEVVVEEEEVVEGPTMGQTLREDVEEAGEYIKDKAEAAGNYIADKAEEAKDYLQDKAEDVKDYVEGSNK